MIEVIGVSFERSDRVYYFDPNMFNLKPNDEVIVDTECGKQFGIVKIRNKNIRREDVNLPVKKVLRKATEEDSLVHKKNKKDANKAFIVCKRLINKYKLNMNLIDANYTFDRRQLLFNFIADNRIDFRELVKELASIYKTRIELRQIGVRDKARKVGGIGPCGMMLCCVKFLYKFDTVSINMAKNQDIALNPSKINGSCGRLLCCLTYEDNQYKELKKGLPTIGDIVKTIEGTGKVISVNTLKREYKVEIKDVGIVTQHKED